MSGGPSSPTESPLLSLIRALGRAGARRLDGTDRSAVIGCGRGASLDDIGGANCTQTWLGWFKADSLNHNDGLFGKGWAFGGNGFGVSNTDVSGNIRIGQDRATTDLSWDSTGNNYLVVGQWCFLAVTLDLGAGATVQAYSGRVGKAASENGGFTGTAGSGARTSDVGNDVGLGNHTGPGLTNLSFRGSVGPCAVFDRVLSLDEMRRWQNAPWTNIPNLKGLWFPGLKGGKVVDWSGNANHGTLTGTVLARGPALSVSRQRWPVRAFSAPAVGARLGTFDPQLVAAAWFDETQVVEGWVTDELIDAPASGGAFSQAMTGSITAVGTLVRSVIRGLTGATTPAAALARQTNRPLTGASAPTGSVSKQPARTLTGSTTPTGALAGAKLALRALTGDLTPTGALASLKLFVRAFTGSTTPSGVLAKQTGRPLTGATAPSGVTAKQTARPLAGSTTPAATLTKQTAKTLTGSTTPTGLLTSLKTYLRALTGAITPTGLLARTGFGRTVAGATTPSGALAKQTARALTGTIAPTGAASRLTFRVIGGTLTPTGLTSKRPGRSLVGGIAPTGTVTPVYNVAVNLLALTFHSEIGPTYTVPLSLAPTVVLQEFTLAPSLTMPSITPNEIPLGADTLIRLKGVKVWDPTTGTRIPATGITITARIAATPTGAAIHASLEVVLVERAAGDFYATIQGTNAETYLRALLGDLVYVVLTIGAQDFLGHYPIRVVDGVRVGA